MGGLQAWRVLTKTSHLGRRKLGGGARIGNMIEFFFLYHSQNKMTASPPARSNTEKLFGNSFGRATSRSCIRLIPKGANKKILFWRFIYVVARHDMRNLQSLKACSPTAPSCVAMVCI